MWTVGMPKMQMLNDVFPEQYSQEELITLWLGATRYYLGRKTYAVGIFVDLLIREWNFIGSKTRDLIQGDVERQFELDDLARERKENYFPLGDDCDRQEWEKLRKLWS